MAAGRGEGSASLGVFDAALEALARVAAGSHVVVEATHQSASGEETILRITTGAFSGRDGTAKEAR